MKISLEDLHRRLQKLEDSNEIAKLQARYINLNDGGWDGPTHRFPVEVADLFIDGGVWDGPPGRAEGKAAIIEIFRSFQALPFIVHYVANPLIEVNGDEAYGEWHAIVTSTVPGSDQALWTLGKYINNYVRTAAGWKYRQLKFVACAISPYELGWAKKQFID